MPPRTRVSERDRLERAQDGICFYCLRPWHIPTVDHVVPLYNQRHGLNSSANKVIACLACNHTKDHRAPTRVELRRLKALKSDPVDWLFGEAEDWLSIK